MQVEVEPFKAGQGQEKRVGEDKFLLIGQDFINGQNEN